MKTWLIRPLLIAGLTLGVSSAQAALLTAINATGTGTFNNSPALLINNAIPAEGAAWTGGTNVWWYGTTPAFTIDFGQLYNIDDVTVSVDNNDSYLVEYFNNNSVWTNLFQIASSVGEIGWGMDTMSSNSSSPEYIASIDFSPIQAQYLRISATGGDNMYAVGEVQAFGSPVPLPAAFWLFVTGMLPLLGALNKRRA